MKGLFFDLDGTLVDSLPLLKAIYEEFLCSFGKEGSDEEFQKINGPPLRQGIEILKEIHGIKEPLSELSENYLTRVREKYVGAKPHQGAFEILEWAVKNGWVCSIVTSSSELLAREWLSRNKMQNLISYIAGHESVKMGKPHPEPYLFALKLSQCDVNESVAVEDSASGVTSALQAGLKTITYAPQLPEGPKRISNLLSLKRHLTHA